MDFGEVWSENEKNIKEGCKCCDKVEKIISKQQAPAKTSRKSENPTFQSVKSVKPLSKFVFDFSVFLF